MRSRTRHHAPPTVVTAICRAQCDVQRNASPALGEEEDLSFALHPAENDLDKADVGAAVGGDLARQLQALGSHMGDKRVHASGGLLVRGAIDFNVVLGVCACACMCACVHACVCVYVLQWWINFELTRSFNHFGQTPFFGQ